MDQVLANIRGGLVFEDAVSSVDPYPFTGGDLGWRKLGDIPSMFASVVPTMSIGEVSKVRSSSGFHIVTLPTRWVEALDQANKCTAHFDQTYRSAE